MVLVPLAGPIAGVRVRTTNLTPVTLTPSRSVSSDTKQTLPGNGDFPATAPAANPVFYRTYSRRNREGRESWTEVGERNLGGLQKLGSLTSEEVKLMARMQAEKKALPSGGCGSAERLGLNNRRIFLVLTTAPPPTLWTGKPSV